MYDTIQSTANSIPDKSQIAGKNKYMDILLQSVFPVLETYSNVHRGSGFNSMVTTRLYEKAREVVLEYLELDKKKYIVVFCSAQRAVKFKNNLNPDSYKLVSGSDFNLMLGVCAFAIKRRHIPGNIPFVTGGGTTRLYSKKWVIEANTPDRLEAGTPAVFNVICFAKALQMIKNSGADIFQSRALNRLTPKEILYNDELSEFSGSELLHHLRNTLIGKNSLVPTVRGMKPFINLDNSASTRTFNPIWNSFSQTLFQTNEIQEDIVKHVKLICSGFLNAPLTEYEIIFTSNTTESINLVAEEMKQELITDIEPVILISFLEHSSNDLPWRSIPGYTVEWLPVDKEGFWNINELEKLLIDYNQKGVYGKKRIKFVSVSGASNVLGTCNNLEETTRIIHKYGLKVLVDGAQLIAHRKVDMSANDIDFLAFSAHKVYAPFGTGVLVARKGLLNSKDEKLALIQSLGEENAAGIAALGKSLLLLDRIGFDRIEEEEQKLIKITLTELKKIPKLKVPGINDPDSPKTGAIVFGFDEMMAGKIAKKLALQAGIGIRYGCHCAHLIVKSISGFTPFLEQFQRLIVLLVPPLKLQGFARVSFGIENTENDVIVFTEELKGISYLVDKQRNKSEAKLVETTKAELKTIESSTNKLIEDICLTFYS